MKVVALENSGKRVVLCYDAHEHYELVDNDSSVAKIRHDWFNRITSLLTAENAQYRVIIEEMSALSDYFSKEYFLNEESSAKFDKLKNLVANNTLNSFLWTIACLHMDRKFVAPGVDLIRVTAPLALFLLTLNEYPHYTLNEYLNELLKLKNRYSILVSQYNDSVLGQDLVELNEYIEKVKRFISDHNAGGTNSQSIYDLLQDNNNGALKEKVTYLKELFFQNSQEPWTSYPLYINKDVDTQIINLISSDAKKSPWFIFMGGEHAENIRRYLVNYCGFQETFVAQGSFQTTTKEYSYDQAMSSFTEMVEEFQQSGKLVKIKPCSIDILNNIPGLFKTETMLLAR